MCEQAKRLHQFLNRRLTILCVLVTLCVPGKALLDESSPESLKAEQEEALAEWEKERDTAPGAATETIADSVSSFMKSLW